LGASQPMPVALAFLCHPDLRCEVAAGRVDIYRGSDELSQVVAPAGFVIDVVRDVAAQPGSQALWSRSFGHIGTATRLLFTGVLGTAAISTAVDIVAQQAASAEKAQPDDSDVRWRAEFCR
jgi:hypothetical protein